MAIILDDRVRAILDRKSFAVLATLNSDGSPHTSVIWVARDGDVVLFTTHDKRRKTRNLQHDPRASITIFDPSDPYQTADIRGVVELVDDPTATLSIELTNKYLGIDPPPDPPGSRRLIARLTPEQVTGMNG